MPFSSLASRYIWNLESSVGCVYHTDAELCSYLPFGNVMYRPFLVKGVSFQTPYFIIPPLFGLTAVPRVYGLGVYCCLLVRRDYGVFWYPMTVLLSGGGGGDLISNWSDILQSGCRMLEVKVFLKFLLSCFRSLGKHSWKRLYPVLLS